MENYDFLDLLIIMSMGMQMQTFIESREQPTHKELLAKLDRIIELLETSELHYVKSIDNANTHP